MKDKISCILPPFASSRWVLVILTLFVYCSESSTVTNERKWEVGDPVLLPGYKGAFDEVAVKDPSLVFFDERWHLFYTARSKDEYTTGYVSARDLNSLRTAPRYALRSIRGREPYGCAPQIFYFESQEKWYLIFQNRDENYQPAFATSNTITDPDAWSEAQPLIHKGEKAKWIDFWVICDEACAYLFYTRDHSSVMVRKTAVESFPQGWGSAKEVFSEVHEAVHVYKVKDVNQYHMIYELNREGIRSFGMATAGNLEGPWRKITDNFANGAQLYDKSKDNPWTEMVSHGEAIRTGYNQWLEIDPQDGRWLVQGILKMELKEPYALLPWKLGIIDQSHQAETTPEK